MKILNYRGYTFSTIEAEGFFVAYFNYIDYDSRIREVCITQQYVGREAIYIVKFSGLTTEYTGGIISVLDKVINHCEKNAIKTIDN